jgi:hypothetical protein
MDKAALVNIDVQRGAEILDALEGANVRVGVALWAYLSEYEDWRLVVSARRFDAMDLRDAYGLIHDRLEEAGVTLEKTPPVMILPMSDPFIRELRRIFGKARSVDGMRLGGQMIGDRFVQDAYVYRIS